MKISGFRSHIHMDVSLVTYNRPSARHDVFEKVKTDPALKKESTPPQTSRKTDVRMPRSSVRGAEVKRNSEIVNMRRLDGRGHCLQPGKSECSRVFAGSLTTTKTGKDAKTTLVLGLLSVKEHYSNMSSRSKIHSGAHRVRDRCPRRRKSCRIQ